MGSWLKLSPFLVSSDTQTKQFNEDRALFESIAREKSEKYASKVRASSGGNAIAEPDSGVNNPIAENVSESEALVPAKRLKVSR